MSTTSKRKIDLKTMLNAVAMADFGWYDRLDEDQQKELSIYALNRFISNSSKYPDMSIIMVNDLANVHANVFYKHKAMHWKLVCAAIGMGHAMRFEYVPPPKRKKLDPMTSIVMEANPLWNETEAQIVLSSMSKKEKRLYLKDRGYQNDEIKKLVK